MSDVSHAFSFGHDFLKFFVKLQSLFTELLDDDVREDFKMGKIIPVDNTITILSSIDVISKMIFPSWKTLKMNNRIDTETSISHLILLWKQSQSNFDIYSNDVELEILPYLAWFEAFEGLFCSPYWQTSDQQDEVSPAKPLLVRFSSQVIGVFIISTADYNKITIK